MTALRPERESGAAAYGDAGDQGSSYGQQPYEVSGALGDWYGRQPYDTPVGEVPLGAAPVDEETMALRIPDPPGESRSAGASAATGTATVTAGSAAIPPTMTTGTTPGGRAARRKAAKRRHRRHAGHAGHADHGAHAGPPTEPSKDDDQRRPLSRVEARRLARARKPSPAVVASRLIGEVFITTGVLMLLFVTYQLWWTNVRAHAQAGNEASQLQDDWASGKRNPGVFQPGQGFALLHIPKLDVVVPIAEGIDNDKVLDRGMVGHYAEGALKTAMPDAKTGNFGLAGHRNTHGEPFRYINRLQPGDPIVVETQDMYYVYDMASILPVTSPSNVSVLDPIPKGSGFTEPGRYITLTTCTPEFTSKYRMIVWGKMVEERPRSKGKPDALVS
ncbi:class E sortase [Streptomyces sp. TRM70350]|uniref:class E sortase n=1 Tax=Streptomyces sp. TRM70350 TaxID=2856165 RepID=UPI001C44D7F5|nr:class E sortase [Streptomyces sp. TRM70350]MBV7698139.1 class E sortase [Streptomyces sp. TRM70350]